MRVLVVFESVFGNTEAVAEAVVAGLRDRHAAVSVRRVGAAGDHDLDGVDLLVLAGPTHAFTMSRPATRADAVARGSGSPVRAEGVREWIGRAGSSARPPVAVLDTRAAAARHWPGSAARSMARALRRSGFAVGERESFYVGDVEGPLGDGELERARAWGRHLAAVHARPVPAEPTRASTSTVLDETECRGLLEAGTVGRVAFLGAEGVVVRPVNYRVAAGDVVFRASLGGELREVADGGTEVVFEVDYHAPSGRQGWCVLVRGRCTSGERPEVFDDDARRPVPWGATGETVLVSLRPASITGRVVKLAELVPTAPAVW